MVGGWVDGVLKLRGQAHLAEFLQWYRLLAVRVRANGIADFDVVELVSLL